jgi:kinesin family protein C2/C3
VSTISIPSQEMLLLHRERAGLGAANNTPLSFEFDGILDSDMDQQDIYDELEEVCLSVLDGYNICVMTYGQSGFGKTYTLLGDVSYEGGKEPVINNYGIHLRAAQQFFSVLKHRSERYNDIVTFSVAEVHDERLCDLLSGTEIGEDIGQMEVSGPSRNNRKRIDSHDGSASQSSKPSKLEIKTNHNGETIVHGLLSVEVSAFEDVYRVWKECLSHRAAKLAEQGVDMIDHDANCHVIGTLKVFSTNISTGVATSGKIQFVDLASSDVVPKRATVASSSKKVPTATPDPMLAGVGNNQEWKFNNRSLATLAEVVGARSQYQRSVPYRNSTITHLLSDSLEADTKVVLVACVSSDLKDLQETACTLKFTQKLRKVVIGKATKHTLTHD